MIEVVIQGVKGCFHEIAAHKFFGEREELQLIECDSFRKMFMALEEKSSRYAVMAIENTVAGSILPNYALLMQSDYTIIGEVYQRIQHQLMSLPGVGLEDLKQVRSHPMALLQCLDFFSKRKDIQLVEAADTAGSAKDLQESPQEGIAVIASSLAAERYSMNIIAEGIETNPRNFTRFLVLQATEEAKIRSDFNKASICFRLGHEVGSLAKVLAVFAENAINLTKIQSLPVIGSEWQYLFLVDLEFENPEIYEKSLSQAQTYLEELKVLGKYRAGIKYRS